MKKNIKKMKLEFIDRIAYGCIETDKIHSILFADVYTYGDRQINDRIQSIISKVSKSYYLFHLN